ncbi:hypothetical protein BCL93_112110 [Onishia taeanensis]|uniref:Uncharacterized protein n=1 Tax=Onishia taeanensis TaxID=284577 RepID=A0A328XRM5_9GAMM|nr:hypothetical protein BCL93_112110 [Halomonas taeanensis]
MFHTFSQIFPCSLLSINRSERSHRALISDMSALLRLELHSGYAEQADG